MKLNINLYASVFLLGTLAASCDNGEDVTPDAKACFSYPSETEINAGEEIVFDNCSEHATSYAWDFGDGEISTDENPSHIYDQGGTYTVKLIAANETSADTLSQNINIEGPNVENFTLGNEKQSLGKAYIHSYNSWETDESGRIHRLVFTEHKNAYLVSTDGLEGEGILVAFTFIGKSSYDIAGEYSFMASSNDWPDPSDVRTVDNLTVLYGPTVLKDYDASIDAESMVVYGDGYAQFDLNISKSGDEYIITFNGTTTDGRAISLNYEGGLEKY